MPILPIDLQTMIGQVDNVSKTQHTQENNPIQQQQHFGKVLENQTILKDNQVRNLEQTDNQDKKVKPDKKSSQEYSEREKKQNQKGKREDKEELIFKDPNKGNIIDIKR